MVCSVLALVMQHCPVPQDIPQVWNHGQQNLLQGKTVIACSEIIPQKNHIILLE
jgi:hypothetical protein